MAYVTRFLIAAMLLLAPAGKTLAQSSDYPNKIIKFVVGYPAGGITDIAARVVATEMEKELGQKILIENRPGASGAIGANIVAKAPADGYTIYYVIASHTIVPALNKQLPYDTVKDFAAISQISSTPNMLAIGKASPINSLKDLIEAAKKSPGALKYSTPGYGTTTHLTVALLEDIAGIKLTHVPYKSSAASVEAAVNGEVTFVSTSVFTGGAAVKEGTLKPLGVISDKRFVTFPDVPTFKELGVDGVIGDTWMGLLAPAGTPKNVIGRLETAVKAIVSKPEFKTKLLELGADTVGSSPDVFQKRIEAEVVAFKALADKIGLKVQ